MIEHLISDNTKRELLQKSRIHKVSSYFNAHLSFDNLYMKREDEIGAGLGGSKSRKHASIVDAINKQKPDIVVVEGSAQSNNVLAVSSLFSSMQIPFKIACPEAKSANKGNAIWLDAISEKNAFIQIGQTSGMPTEYYQELLKVNNVYVIKEGAAQIDAIPGLLGLSSEIIAFEMSEEVCFERIFIDAGTGISAIGLLIGLALLGRSDVDIVITLIAGDENSFEQLLNEIVNEFNTIHNQAIEVAGMNYKLLKPKISRSFGSINRTLIKEWRIMMCELGMAIDIIYTSKHFYTIKQVLELEEHDGTTLIINGASPLAARNFSHLL